MFISGQSNPKATLSCALKMLKYLFHQVRPCKTLAVHLSLECGEVAFYLPCRVTANSWSPAAAFNAENTTPLGRMPFSNSTSTNCLISSIFGGKKKNTKLINLEQQTKRKFHFPLLPTYYKPKYQNSPQEN